MSRVVRVLLPALLALAPVAMAAPAAASAPVGVRYQGSLNEVLHQIAEKGGINLIVVGKLDAPADVYLPNATPEQAIESIVHSYRLDLSREGNVWTITAPGAAPTAANAPAQVQKQKPADEDQSAADEEKNSADEDQEASDSDEDQAENAPAPVPPSGLPRGVTPPPVPAPPRVRFGPHGLAISLAGGPRNIAEGQKVDGDVAANGNLVVDGEVTGDAVAYGGSVTVNGRVRGDVAAFGGNIVLGPNGEIDGSASAIGGRIDRAEGSVIHGSQTSIGGPAIGSLVADGIRSGVENIEPRHEHHHGGALGLAFLLLQFVVFFGVGFLFMIFAPSAMKKIENDVSRSPLLGIVTGFLSMLGLSALSLLLTITVIGIPLVVVIWLAVAVGLAMGFTALAHEIGVRLPVMRGRKTQAIVLALGVLILLAIEVIPVLGPTLLVVLGMLGIGAIVRTRFGTRPKGFPEPV